MPRAGIARRCVRPRDDAPSGGILLSSGSLIEPASPRIDVASAMTAAIRRWLPLVAALPLLASCDPGLDEARPSSRAAAPAGAALPSAFARIAAPDLPPDERRALLLALLEDAAAAEAGRGELLALLASQREEADVACFVLAALESDDLRLRRVGAAAAAFVPTSLSTWRRGRHLEREHDDETQRLLLAASRDRRLERGVASAVARVWMRAMGLADEIRTRRLAEVLFDAAARRTPGLPFTPTWPGRPGDEVHGWGPRGDGPLRPMAAEHATILVEPLVWPRGLIVAARMPADRGSDRLQVRFEGRHVGTLQHDPRSGERDPGPDGRGLSHGSWTLPIAESEARTSATISLSRSAGSPVIEVAGAVLVEHALLDGRWSTTWLGAAPLGGHDAENHALDVATVSHPVAPAPFGGLRLEADRHVVTFHLEEKDVARVVELHLDHRTEGREDAVWNVALNGRPLVALISQAMPRAGRAFFPERRIPLLQAGENRLELERRSGGALVLDGLRLVR